MKAKFNKAALQESLGLVAGVVPARTPKPILQCIRVDIEKDSAMFSATDLEVGINCRIDQVEVDKPGVVVLPADKINAIVRETSDPVLTLETDDASVIIKGSDSEFTIYGHEASQYPAVPGFEGESDFELSLEALQQGIEHTVFAAAKESTRYAINGILWEVKGKKLTLVATDGRRLAKTVVHLDSTASKKLAEQRIIVPSKAMSLLDRIGDDPDTQVSVRFVDNKIVISCGQVVLSSNLVEGNFPKYEDIIPSGYDKALTLPTAPVLSAVRRAALLANEDSKGIKIALGSNTMTFSGRAPETGDARVDMSVEYSGEAIEIGFNPQFLIDVLKVLKQDQFVLELGEQDRPGVIKSGDDFLYIVMPVSI